MILFWIVGGALLFLGVLAVIILQMPDSPIMKKKKEKRLPPPEPPKDWQGIAERLDKRAHSLEAKLQEYERAFRDKDKEIAEKQAVITGLEQQFNLEQTWRKKEEDAVDKEKKHEKLLESELGKARDSLNIELTQRIKMEYEVKDLRLLKETQGADVRHLSGRNMELDRQVKSLTEENRRIKAENAVLQVKKEADQWVAKDDYVHVDKMLKRARWEVDQFKRKFPKEMWPKSILPKMEPVKPLDAQAAAPAEPVAPKTDVPAPAPTVIIASAEPEVPVLTPTPVAEPAAAVPAVDEPVGQTTIPGQPIRQISGELTPAPSEKPSLPAGDAPAVDAPQAAPGPAQEPGKENVPTDTPQPQ